jgi:hypothetical protein
MKDSYAHIMESMESPQLDSQNAERNVERNVDRNVDQVQRSSTVTPTIVFNNCDTLLSCIRHWGTHLQPSGLRFKS